MQCAVHLLASLWRDLEVKVRLKLAESKRNRVSCDAIVMRCGCHGVSLLFQLRRLLASLECLSHNSVYACVMEYTTSIQIALERSLDQGSSQITQT